MKTTAVLTAIFATAAVVFADSCNRGGVYCGNYRDHILQTLQAAGQQTDEAHIQNSKFNCVANGDIIFQEYCANGCGGTTSEDPDYCL
ncbi:hypothetical protein SLS62_008013 [Diatrype stigma]|uniref:Uncharacterized protein n=1 Tax=Diatrype stigma TaxID=117547 RepID=A0AAN9YMY3_9PEZI